MNVEKGRKYLYNGADFFFIFLFYLGIPVFSLALLGTRNALATIITFHVVKRFVTSRLLGLCTLTILDEMFLLDYPENRANILTVMKLSKVRDAEELRQFLIKKITAFDRCRSKLVKFFHEYYFKRLTEKELAAATKECFITLDSIDTDLEL
jgi:hypothetical protein